MQHAIDIEQRLTSRPIHHAHDMMPLIVIDRDRAGDHSGAIELERRFAALHPQGVAHSAGLLAHQHTVALLCAQPALQRQTAVRIDIEILAVGDVERPLAAKAHRFFQPPRFPADHTTGRDADGIMVQGRAVVEPLCIRSFVKG